MSPLRLSGFLSEVLLPRERRLALNKVIPGLSTLDVSDKELDDIRGTNVTMLYSQMTPAQPQPMPRMLAKPQLAYTAMNVATS